MRRKEVVQRAIHFQSPPSVPILFFNKDKEQSDIIMIDVVKHFQGNGKDLSEWGFRWEKHDQTMGQPKTVPLSDWDELESFTIPDPYDTARFSDVQPMMESYPDRYYVGSLVLSGFTVLTFLRGFSNLLIDMYEAPDNFERLADMVFGFEEEIIKQLAGYGMDAVGFFDDWGTQESLIISPELWRALYKPRYKRQFDIAHDHGLDVYFHTCGYVYPIISDFIEIGVDVLNISQPNLYDIKKLGDDFRGRVCFICPVSYQTTSLSGTKTDIFNDVASYMDHLKTDRGGFLGYVEYYPSIGMPDENYEYCIRAFRELGSRGK